MPRMMSTTASATKKIVVEPEVKKNCCLYCGSTDQDNFYKSFSPFTRTFGKLPYCKDCVKDVLWNYFYKRYNGSEQLAMHGLLRMLNLPYIHSVYLASVKNVTNPKATISGGDEDETGARANPSALVSAYMKNYNSMHERNNYGDTYLESEGLNEIAGLECYEEKISVKRKRHDIDPNTVDTDKYELLEYDADELLNKWGDFPDDKLIQLELEYLDWSDKLGEYISDKSVDLVVTQVCHQTIEIREKRERGEKVKDDIASLQGLLNSSGLIEKTREKNAETVQIGQTIREIENARPIKECIPELVDVDHYGDLIDTFTGAMCRTLGKENIFTRKFDKLYDKYSLDLDGLAKQAIGDDESGQS